MILLYARIYVYVYIELSSIQVIPQRKGEEKNPRWKEAITPCCSSFVLKFGRSRTSHALNSWAWSVFESSPISPSLSIHTILCLHRTWSDYRTQYVHICVSYLFIDFISSNFIFRFVVNCFTTLASNDLLFPIYDHYKIPFKSQTKSTTETQAAPTG